MRAAQQPGWSATTEAKNSLTRVADQEIRQLLPPAEAVAAIEQAFGEDYGAYVFPERQHIDTAGSIFLVMPCHNRKTGRLGVKFVTVRKQASASEPTVQASYLLFDPMSGEPQLWLQANWLTDLRTAATSFVAGKFLARRDARVLGIFGTGRLARAHIEIFARLRNFERILVCGSSVEHSRKFLDSMPRDLAITTLVADADALAAEADIICACTTASQPLFDGSLLRPGTHLNLVGAFQPNTREADSVTMSRARVVVDTYVGALHEAGDVLIPMQEGKLARDGIGELHEIVSGIKPARQTDQEITVFKSVGCALEDLAVAELIAARLEQASA